MKLIVGLGNPGKKYEKNRHNLGFMVIDKLIKDLDLSFKRCKRTNSLRSAGFFAKNKVILAKPLTFMNNSGSSVQKLVSYYKIKPQDIWIIHDDVDLSLGKIRIKHKGSSGGHKGITSIIEHLKNPFFNRLKIGIGSNRELNVPAEKYVLQNFNKEELSIIKKTLKKALNILEDSLK